MGRGRAIDVLLAPSFNPFHSLTETKFNILSGLSTKALVYQSLDRFSNVFNGLSRQSVGVGVGVGVGKWFVYLPLGRFSNVLSSLSR